MIRSVFQDWWSSFSFLGLVLVTASCTILRTSSHSSSDALSSRSIVLRPLPPFFPEKPCPDFASVKVGKSLRVVGCAHFSVPRGWLLSISNGFVFSSRLWLITPTRLD